jgi:hypothetical protein
MLIRSIQQNRVVGNAADNLLNAGNQASQTGNVLLSLL